MITESQTICTDRISVRKKVSSYAQSVTVVISLCFYDVTWSPPLHVGCRLLICSFYHPQLDVKEAKIVKDHPQWDISDDEEDKANNEDESEEEEDSDYSSEDDGSD